jgi:hypothetical protein
MTMMASVSRMFPSLCMQLDEALDTLDSLSSTQLYGAIVGFTVIACWAILAMSGTADTPELPAPTGSVVTKTIHKGPEPRWHIFRWVNVFAVVVFAWSVADFSLNATTYWNDSDSNVLFQFLIGWSSLLCYFFGFFGVSFVHDLEDAETVAETRKR